MNAEFVRNPYNYDSDQLSTDTGLRCEDESLTEQDHLEESDINYIAEKFLRTGQAPQVLNMPNYGDFEGIFDFQSAMNLINAAKAEFMSLPAKVRSRFNNDPQELLDFIENPENHDEAIRLGFIQKRDTLPTQSNLTNKETTNGRESSSTPQGQQEERTRLTGAETAPRKSQGSENA